MPALHSALAAIPAVAVTAATFKRMADGRFPNFPADQQKYKLNRTNIFYLAPHNLPWDGTTGYAGNVGHQLYEWPMGTSAPLKFHERPVEPRLLSPFLLTPVSYADSPTQYAREQIVEA